MKENPKRLPKRWCRAASRNTKRKNCLLRQAFIKDDKKTVNDLLKAAGALSINRFVFYVMGEGLEKKSEDLNAEVAKQVAAMKK